MEENIDLTEADELKEISKEDISDISENIPGVSESIYGKLYDLVAANIQDAEEELVFTKQIFEYSAVGTPGIADMSDFINFDNMEFLQASYVAYFFRIPDLDAQKRWEKEKKLQDTAFQKKLTTSLVKSQEFIDKGVKLRNNIYSSHAQIARNVPIASNQFKSENQAINRLYHYYKKFPKPIRKVVRKIAGLKN